MTPEDRSRVVIMIVSLMGLGFLGVVLNNVVYTSIKELQKHLKSPSNMILGNLCFCNLLVSTVVLNLSAIYVSYALATASTDANIAQWARTRTWENYEKKHY